MTLCIKMIKRHIVKTVTWRIIGTLDTIIIGSLLTGSKTVGVSIGGLELITKTVLYYMHERIWYKSKYGIIKNEIYDKRAGNTKRNT